MTMHVHEHNITHELNAGLHAGLSANIYHELRVIAHSLVRSHRPSGTLNTTALVHEAYLKMGDHTRGWHNRKHFFATMAQAMRHVCVDLARRRSAGKRDGGIRLTWDNIEQGQICMDQLDEVIAIDQALCELGRMDERLEKVMELRFFGGASVADAARILDVSEPTIKRDWRVAKAFLASQLAA